MLDEKIAESLVAAPEIDKWQVAGMYKIDCIGSFDGAAFAMEGVENLSRDQTP